MGELSPEDAEAFDALIEEYGPDILQQYMTAVFPPIIIKVKRMTIANAPDWINVAKFTDWLVAVCQEDAARAGQATPLRSLSNGLTSSPSKESSLCTPTKARSTAMATRTPSRKAYCAPSSSLPPSSPPGYTPSRRGSSPLLRPSSPPPLSESSPLPELVYTTLTLEKRKHQLTAASDDVIVVSPAPSPASKPKRKKKKQDAVDFVVINRQTSIRRLISLPAPQLPPYFDVPHDKKDVAYLLDLNQHPQAHHYKDKAGKELDIGSLIIRHNYDSFNTKLNKWRQTAVVALGGVECFVLEFFCNGVYHCSEFNTDMLNGYERFEADDDNMKDLFLAEQDLSKHSTQSLAARAVAFYHDTMSKPCKMRSCDGVAVYRKFKSISSNYDGKEGFIGCSGWAAGDQTGDHRFITIPRQFCKRVVKHLFQHEGRIESDDLSEANTQACSRMQAPRNGGKGAKRCPYPHFRDGQVIEGRMIERVCPARGTIYYPVDSDDRRAIILLQDSPHNHPTPPPSKTTPMGEALYTQAVEKVADKTMLRVDMAPTTLDIFGSQLPCAIDPGLSSARKRRDIVRSVRVRNHPHGLGWEGVAAMAQCERADVPGDRYIQVMNDEGDTRIIVTMFQAGAQLLLEADVSFNDNTYKQMAGDWKEWEVVVWNARLERRVTVARIYCERETRVAFAKMWKYLWDTVERLTGEPMKFHFLDGTGIKAIIVDGCKRQAEGLGDDLAERSLKSNNPDFGGKKHDPLEIVQYILKTCITHFERKVDELARVCKKEVIDKVRACQFVKTRAEADELVRYYKSSSHKCIRDWIADKDQAPWFLPSINEFLSKMPARIWYETDMTTNINESAHPFTNKMTGTGRPLVESIERARNADRMIFDQLDQYMAKCVLPNSQNTFATRLRANRLRQDSRLRVVAEKSSKGQELARLSELIREAQQQKKALTQEGVKAPRAKKGSRGKSIPNAIKLQRPSSPPLPIPSDTPCDASAESFASRPPSLADSSWIDNPLGTNLSPKWVDDPLGMHFIADVNSWDMPSWELAPSTLPSSSSATLPPALPENTGLTFDTSTWTPWSGSNTQQTGASSGSALPSNVGSAITIPTPKKQGQILSWSSKMGQA